MSIVEIIAQQITGNHSSILTEHAIETAKDIESALKLNGVLGAAASKPPANPDLPAAAIEGDRYVFEINELPEYISPITQGRVPAVRSQVGEFAKANPGQWVKYPRTQEDPYKKPSDLANRANKGIAGFPKGLTACVRNKIIYIRYDAPVDEEAAS